MGNIRIIAGMTYQGQYSAETGYLIGQVVCNADNTAMYVSKVGSEENRNIGRPLSDGYFWHKCLSIEDAISTISQLGEELSEAETQRVQAELLRVQEDLNRGQRTNTAIANAEAAASLVNELAAHPTYFGEDLYMYVWDVSAHAYNKTSINAGAQLRIDHIYPSVAALEADTSDIPDGKIAVINTNDVENPENARFYIRMSGSWRFLCDLSGLQGAAGKTPQITIGTVTAGSNVSSASASLSPDGFDDLGNPKFKINLVLPVLSYTDLTPEQIAELQRPAAEKVAEFEQKEQLWDDAEEERKRQENERQQKETERENQELERENQERDRKAAEQQRQQDFESAQTTRDEAFQRAEQRREQLFGDGGWGMIAELQQEKASKEELAQISEFLYEPLGETTDL